MVERESKEIFLKTLLKRLMNFQQHLVRNIWRPFIRHEAIVSMIIKGKILKTVNLDDIGKKVDLGKEISLTEYEVNRSKDLKNALNRDWVEVVYDRGMLKRAVTVQGQKAQETIDQNTMEIAKKLAVEMAVEMIKNSSLVKDIAKEVAKEIASELKGNITTEQIVTKQEKIKPEDPRNVFVDFKDEEAGVTANINKESIVEVQDDLASSLEKMKKFKQSQKSI